jgi:formylglycine-generating enzyme required for sulfatase activity
MGWFDQFKSRVTVSTWLVAALTVGLGFLPVFSRPGYESALLFGLLVPWLTAASAALAIQAPGGIEERLLSALGRAGAHGLVLSALLSLHAIRVGWCDPLHDLSLLALGPVAGIVTAAFWGSFAGLCTRHFCRQSGSRWVSIGSVGVAILGPLLGVVVGVVGFYRSPSVFAFDQFAGFFAGSPYDTGFDPVGRLLTYRAGSLGLWLFLWALARHVERQPSDRLRLCLFERDPRGRIKPSPRLDRAVVAVGLLGLGLFVAIASLGEHLGHRSSTAWIRRTLGRSVSVGRCEVVSGPAQRQVAVDRLAEECNAWLLRLERRLGTGTLPQVTVYVFDGAMQKERLMGAGHTQIAKPWRREIYLNGANFPDDVLGHELAHVVAGLVARGPFKIAGTFGGWLPNPGLIEGVAVALAPDEDGELTPLEWSAALHSIGKLPQPSRLFSLAFLGHSGPLAYTTAGAFVEWLGQRYGKRALRRWYAGESIERVTGAPFGELDRRFIAGLDRVQLSEGAREAALAKFARLGVYSRRCPHAVDHALGEADQRLAAGDPTRACALYAEARKLDSAEVRARFGLAECAERDPGSPGGTDRAERAYRAIADDTSQPLPVRERAREKLADMLFSSGNIEQARPIYQQLLLQSFEVSRLRMLEVKLSARSETAIRAVRTLLLGVDGQESFDLAVRDLVRWSNDAPDDGIPDYLLGRNYWQRGHETAATEHLDRALGRELRPAHVRAEALRLRAVVACAHGDRPRAVALAEALANDPALPTPRRLGILRIVERCAGRLLGDDWPETAAATAVDPATPASESATKDPTGSRPEVTNRQQPLAFDSDEFECPKGMEKIRGGKFWVGSKRGTQSPDETPRFLTNVRGFCLDRTEVTVEAFGRCVQAGQCRPALGRSYSCNARHTDRDSHPVNCVDHPQAAGYCATLGARLPTEVEWEYAARGGEKSLKYPWGDGSPDGRACWKTSSSCRVASYAPGAFGLFDMTGNVWEWTSSDFAEYPWSRPALGEPSLKVYRGGGWSRRFEKWMHVGLRNRSVPQGQGAHLGMRCASDAANLECPFGAASNGTCRFGVLDAECPTGQSWNGLRCARPGEPACPSGTHALPTEGCQRDLPLTIKSEPLDLEAIERQPNPEFDADCLKNQPSRPRAYRFSGSTHEARNLAARRAGCKNRDVGVGWNSTCCP